MKLTPSLSSIRSMHTQKDWTTKVPQHSSTYPVAVAVLPMHTAVGSVQQWAAAVVADAAEAESNQRNQTISFSKNKFICQKQKSQAHLYGMLFFHKAGFF